MSVELLDAATILAFVKDEKAFTKSVSTRFSALDTDCDGFLSYGEMMEELKLFETGNANPDEAYKFMFRQFDQDHNGVVDFEEFKEGTKKMMVAMAKWLGFLPFHMVLAQDSLLLKAVELERGSFAAN